MKPIRILLRSCPPVSPRNLTTAQVKRGLTNGSLRSATLMEKTPHGYFMNGMIVDRQGRLIPGYTGGGVNIGAERDILSQLGNAKEETFVRQMILEEIISGDITFNHITNIQGEVLPVLQGLGSHAELGTLAQQALAKLAPAKKDNGAGKGAGKGRGPGKRQRPPQTRLSQGTLEELSGMVTTIFTPGALNPEEASITMSGEVLKALQDHISALEQKKGRAEADLAAAKAENTSTMDDLNAALISLQQVEAQRDALKGEKARLEQAVQTAETVREQAIQQRQDAAQQLQAAINQRDRARQTAQTMENTALTSQQEAGKLRAELQTTQQELAAAKQNSDPEQIIRARVQAYRLAKAEVEELDRQLEVCDKTLEHIQNLITAAEQSKGKLDAEARKLETQLVAAIDREIEGARKEYSEFVVSFSLSGETARRTVLEPKQQRTEARIQALVQQKANLSANDPDLARLKREIHEQGETLASLQQLRATQIQSRDALAREQAAKEVEFAALDQEIRHLASLLFALSDPENTEN